MSLHNGVPPSDAEWEAYVKEISVAMKQSPDGVRGFSLTDGGAPNAKQRHLITELIKDRVTKPRTTVVTESAIGRGVITALSWFNPSMKGFSPAEMWRAVEHIEIAPEHRALFHHQLLQWLEEFPIASAKKLPRPS